MRNISRMIRQAARCGALLVTALVGMSYLVVGNAYAGAGDEKKAVVLQVKDVKVELVVKEAAEAKGMSDINAFAIRNVNPFVIRNVNPFVIRNVNPFAIRNINPFFVRPFFNPFFVDVDEPFLAD